MATGGNLNSTTVPKSKKVKSITILRNLEIQGTLVNNAMEVNKDLIRFEGSNGSSDGLGGLFANNNNVDIIWGTQTDPSNLESVGVYTAPVNGLYCIQCFIEWAASAAGNRGILINIDDPGAGAGANVAGVRIPAASAGVTRLNTERICRMAQGWTVIFRAFQNSGGLLGLTNSSCNIQLLRITAAPAGVLS